MTEIAAVGMVDYSQDVLRDGPVSSSQKDILTLGAKDVAYKSLPNGFIDIVTEGISRMDTKVSAANRMVTEFALDDNTPLHQVTIALEEARLAVEFATQIRQRLVEAYREVVNMQI